MRVIAYKTLREFGQTNPAYRDVVVPRVRGFDTLL